MIATDLDGTFLQGGDSPHPENIQAVKECQKAGIKVCACTGRSFNRAKDIIEQAGFDQFCVVNNGASIVDWRTGQHRYRNRFEPESIGKIVDVMMSYHASFGLTGFETLYMLEGYVGAWYQALDEDMRRQLNGHIYRTKYNLHGLGDCLGIRRSIQHRQFGNFFRKRHIHDPAIADRFGIGFSRTARACRQSLYAKPRMLA